MHCWREQMECLLSGRGAASALLHLRQWFRYAHVRAHTCARMRTHMHTHTYARKHVHVHTHTHTQTCTNAPEVFGLGAGPVGFQGVAREQRSQWLRDHHPPRSRCPGAAVYTHTCTLPRLLSVPVCSYTYEPGAAICIRCSYLVLLRCASFTLVAVVSASGHLRGM